MFNTASLNDLAIITKGTMVFVGFRVNEFNIGTFNVVGNVIISSYDPDVDYISLDATGKILTLGNLNNILGGTYADASDSLYIEFTPSSLIKNKDGVSIDTNTKVREANGSKHF